MDDLGPDEQKWLDVLRSSSEPTTNDRARVRASVLATIAGGAVGTSTAAAASTAAAGPGVAKVGAVASAAGSTSLFTGGLKVGLAVVVLAVGGGGAFVAVKRPTTVTPVAAAASAAAPTEREAPAAAPAELPAGMAEPQATPVGATPQPETVDRSPAAVSARPAARRAASTPKMTAESDDIDAQLVLITQAQRALERGEPNAALTALARHERDYPRGSLAPEREGLRAIASCDAKRSNGRALAERFVAANPSSPLVARIRKSCLSQ
ncbi:hypothetical protein AKJ09_09283 [Labilithrix luteola]|uniref:Uncharacterized protein n=1 Tax=Labilithrix luteola TaxID=1391654 RepID=A0A0K1QB29_9BACT|nr:hypothetical protein [Labilithrix luteola]AKV02620.1 hypothetical protein AKJ09_09283 [Labilithrix luteola]